MSSALAFVCGALASTQPIRASQRHSCALAGASVGPLRRQALGRGGAAATMATPPVEPARVLVRPDADAVAAALCERLEAAAARAIAERGHFALAIPGGSILKMLKGTAPAWAAQTTLAYVNHKAVDMADASLATHAKARALFLDRWEGVHAVVMGGSADAAAEAAAYEAQLRSLSPQVLPRSASGAPVFDMMLIGVGDDGHVGSLCTGTARPARGEAARPLTRAFAPSLSLPVDPGRPEVSAVGGEWVLPVEMKLPGSISLSLPAMAAAREVVVAACGVSDKYPRGKSAAMRRAIEAEDETPASFPAVGLRGCALWILDSAAAGELSAEYYAR